MNNEERAICDAALARIHDEECKICDVVSQRIRKEKPNFEHIVAARRYSKDPLHKKAVTQYSFEELITAMKYLSHVLEFRVDAMELPRLAEQQLSRTADERDAVRILSSIEQPEPRLEVRARGSKVRGWDAVQF